MKRTLAIALCTASAALVACGGDGGDDSASGSEPDAPAATTNADESSAAKSSSAKSSGSRSGRTGASVKVMRSRYGRMLFDGKGRALYLFTRERTSRSRCYGDCATAWPPFLTSGEPRASRGAKSSLLGTTRRRDGKRQVTYRGHPLYYYVSDRKPGQVTCQDVDEFGGTWLVVSPSGRAIR